MADSESGYGIHDRPTSRPGPPWEQPGPFLNRYIETAKGVLLDPNTLFATMRRTGGFGAPLTYGMLGMVIGIIGSFLIQLALPFGGMPGMGGMPRPTDVAGLLIGLCVVPIIALLGLFIGSGIIHLVLSLVGGAREGYETTFRVVAYTNGSTGPLSIVPFCGGLIGAVWGVVAMILGLAKAHETTTGKSAAAVLIPVAVCCILSIVFAAAMVAFIAAMVGAANQS
jgi:hypothetical protein